MRKLSQHECVDKHHFDDQTQNVSLKILHLNFAQTLPSTQTEPHNDVTCPVLKSLTLPSNSLTLSMDAKWKA